MPAAFVWVVVSLLAAPDAPVPPWVSNWANWLAQVSVPLVLFSVTLFGQNVHGEKSEKRDTETHDAVMAELALLRGTAVQLDETPAPATPTLD
jgi:hypothetical protein